MKYLLLLLALFVEGCASKLEIKVPSLTEVELTRIMDAFESDCNCGESKATLIVSCAENKEPAKEGACFEVFMDGNHPVLGQTDEKPLYCSIRETNEQYAGIRMARENGTQITVVSGCVR